MKLLWFGRKGKIGGKFRIQDRLYRKVRPDYHCYIYNIVGSSVRERSQRVFRGWPPMRLTPTPWMACLLFFDVLGVQRPASPGVADEQGGG